MIIGFVVAYAAAKGVLDVVTTPGVDLGPLRAAYPPPYVVRQITEEDFRALRGWPRA